MTKGKYMKFIKIAFICAIITLVAGILTANSDNNNQTTLEQLIKNAEHDAKIERQRRYTGLSKECYFYYDHIEEMKELNANLKTLIEVIRNK